MNEDSNKCHAYDICNAEINDVKALLYSLKEANIQRFNVRISYRMPDDQRIRFLKALDKLYCVQRDENEYQSYCDGVEDIF